MGFSAFPFVLIPWWTPEEILDVSVRDPALFIWDVVGGIFLIDRYLEREEEWLQGFKWIFLNFEIEISD